LKLGLIAACLLGMLAGLVVERLLLATTVKGDDE
jgi:hypothetical protein